MASLPKLSRLSSHDPCRRRMIKRISLPGGAQTVGRRFVLSQSEEGQPQVIGLPEDRQQGSQPRQDLPRPDQL